MAPSAIAGEQPLSVHLVGYAMTTTDRKVAHQSGERLGQPKVIAREGDDRPSLLVTNIGEPQPDDACEGLPIEDDERSGDAIGHGDAVVGHQPARDRPAVFRVGEGRGRPTRRSREGHRRQVALLAGPSQKRDHPASSGAGTDQPFLDVGFSAVAEAATVRSKMAGESDDLVEARSGVAYRVGQVLAGLVQAAETGKETPRHPCPHDATARSVEPGQRRGGTGFEPGDRAAFAVEGAGGDEKIAKMLSAAAGPERVEALVCGSRAGAAHLPENTGDRLPSEPPCRSPVIGGGQEGVSQHRGGPLVGLGQQGVNTQPKGAGPAQPLVVHPGKRCRAAASVTDSGRTLSTGPAPQGFVEKQTAPVAVAAGAPVAMAVSTASPALRLVRLTGEAPAVGAARDAWRAADAPADKLDLGGRTTAVIARRSGQGGRRLPVQARDQSGQQHRLALRSVDVCHADVSSQLAPASKAGRHSRNRRRHRAPVEPVIHLAESDDDRLRDGVELDLGALTTQARGAHAPSRPAHGDPPDAGALRAWQLGGSGPTGRAHPPSPAPGVGLLRAPALTTGWVDYPDTVGAGGNETSDEAIKDRQRAGRALDEHTGTLGQGGDQPPQRPTGLSRHGQDTEHGVLGQLRVDGRHRRNHLLAPSLLLDAALVATAAPPTPPALFGISTDQAALLATSLARARLARRAARRADPAFGSPTPKRHRPAAAGTALQLGHVSLISAGRGTLFLAPVARAPPVPVALALVVSATGSIRSDGPQPKMSHSAIRVRRLRRSGVCTTSR